MVFLNLYASIDMPPAKYTCGACGNILSNDSTRTISVHQAKCEPYLEQQAQKIQNNTAAVSAKLKLQNDMRKQALSKVKFTLALPISTI